MPDMPDTQDEKVTRWLKQLEKYTKGDEAYGEEYEQELAMVREDARAKEGGGGSKYSRVLGSESIVRMMLQLRRWGPHFRKSDGLKTSQLQSIVKVYGGVSEFR
jgi:hypothetical protein